MMNKQGAQILFLDRRYMYLVDSLHSRANESGGPMRTALFPICSKEQCMAHHSYAKQQWKPLLLYIA